MNTSRLESSVVFRPVFCFSSSVCPLPTTFHSLSFFCSSLWARLLLLKGTYSFSFSSSFPFLPPAFVKFAFHTSSADSKQKSRKQHSWPAANILVNVSLTLLQLPREKEPAVYSGHRRTISHSKNNFTSNLINRLENYLWIVNISMQ